MSSILTYIGDHRNLVGGSVLVIIVIVLFFWSQLRGTGKEGLCITPECRSTVLLDGRGLSLDELRVEPKDPYETSSMVVPVLPANAKTGETLKKNYLVRANMPYLHVDDDQLNRELLPGPGFLFVGP
jgi:hypothetical protein